MSAGERRPVALGYAFASLGAVALGAGHRQAGNGNCLAAQGVSIVLALEEPGREVGKTLREPRSTRANPADEHGESTVGRTTDSWRVVETGNTSLSSDCSQVHGATAEATYEHSRTHLALEKDAPESRAIQLPEVGVVMELAQVGGLDHRYERRAA